MKKLWSISTTVRNPERLRNFLKVLKLLEGKPFNAEHQKKYQILLIQYKYYVPKSIPPEFKIYYQNPDLKMDFDIAENIFNYNNYEDPAMRGRQSVNPLNKLGFCIARAREGNIIITELGNSFISGDYDIGDVFFKSLLKLQFPNPWSNDFTEKDGFDIQPLIATMHLINRVNKKSEKKGLTRAEFSLFVPSLINYKFIDRYAQRVLEYRKSEMKEQFKMEFAKDFYETNNPTRKQLNNFSDYGDNTMRYFRLTRYFRVFIDRFGADWRIDLEPSRKAEIDQLLKTFSGHSLEFKTSHSYLKYISDISLPELPFEEVQNLRKVASSLVNTINSFVKDYHPPLSMEQEKILKTQFDTISKGELTHFIASLRKLNLELVETKERISLTKDFSKIKSIISDLKNFTIIKKYSSEQFEKIIAEALKIINDEIKIKPNYPVDDSGEPITHALGNQADIECYYKSYNIVCEVTLDTSNFQWVRETQPVMRHLRDFENKYDTVENYCLFITPRLHKDTLYHFWTSVRYGYDGSRQKIIPLTTEQFALLLETLLSLINRGKRLSHLDTEILYNEIVNIAEKTNGHSEWAQVIPEILSRWSDNLLK